VTDDACKIEKIILKLQLIILIRFSPVEYSELPLTDISITLTAASGAQKSTPKPLFLGKKHRLLHVPTHANT
jgi:hypothetical protein